MNVHGGRSLWSVTAEPGISRAPLCTARRADVVVVGAGYTGLSAALHLAEAGREVVVLDARDVGDGASGLNGGQVIPGLKYDPDTLESLFGAALGPRLVATVAAGPDLVFDLIRRLGIVCDAVRGGWLQLATSPAALATLEARAAQWRRRGAAVDTLNAAEAARLSGSTRYLGGLLDRRGGTVHPLSYVRGLARGAERAGATLHPHSAAMRLTRAGAQWCVTTERGSVTAGMVILATNAYSDHFVGELRRTVVAVPSLQVATAPLPADVRGTVLPGGQAVSDTWQLLRYFRTDATGRLLMGSRGVFGNVSPAAAAGPHYRAVRELFPQLDGIAFEYHWAGWVAMTPDHMPHLHEIAPGVLAGLGYNGRGVAMATVMGRLLAERVLGRAAEELGFPVTPLRPIRLHAWNRLGVGVAIQYLRMADAWGRVREGRRRTIER